MTTRLLWTTELVTTECWCGIPHAIPASLMRQARESKQTVWCPVGHQWSFTESDADRLRKKLADQEQIAASRLARIDQEKAAREAVERRLSAAKGQATKLRKRAAKGVCPCCNRQFANVERHMTSKHPGYAGDELLGGSSSDSDHGATAPESRG